MRRKHTIPELMGISLPSLEVEATVNPPRRHELLIEVVKLTAALIALAGSVVGLSAKYPSLSKPLLDGGIILAALIFVWLVAPRIVAGWQGFQSRNRERQFMAAQDVRLRELLARFSVFLSNNNTRSLVYILRSACSQNPQAVEHIVTGDYLCGWLVSFQEQLAFPIQSMRQFLARCREFSSLVQAFNTNYAILAQRKLANGPALGDHNIAQLEEFREEYNPFLRDMESWTKVISDYLQSGYVEDQSSLWRSAPISFFNRVPKFGQRKS